MGHATCPPSIVVPVYSQLPSQLTAGCRTIGPVILKDSRPSPIIDDCCSHFRIQWGIEIGGKLKFSKRLPDLTWL